MKCATLEKVKRLEQFKNLFFNKFMLIPSKHERLEKNLLVIGGDILSILKKRKIWNIEDLFQNLKKVKSINLNQYYNTITFLWLSGIIQVDEYNILLKQKNVAQ